MDTADARADQASAEDSACRFVTAAIYDEELKGSDNGVWAPAFWQAAEAQGLTLAAVPEDRGGIGGPLDYEIGILRAIARNATPLPLAETNVSGWILAEGGLEAPRGPLGFICSPFGATLRLRNGRVSGTADRVPWGRAATGLVGIIDGRVVLLDPRRATIVPGSNIAGEPRDRVTFDEAEIGAIGGDIKPDLLLLRVAAMRAVQIAAASATAIEIAIGFAKDRVQFGKPIGSFQAVHQQLAMATSHVAAAHTAALYAYLALVKRSRFDFYGAIAKARASETAGIVSGVAHQVTAAMGFTREFPLQRYTRRLQSWRTEAGNEHYWCQRIGFGILEGGADRAWPTVSDAIDGTVSTALEPVFRNDQ